MSDNYRYGDSVKSDNFKESPSNVQNGYKKWNKEVKSRFVCYRKLERAITNWWVIEKSPIFDEKNCNKNYSTFWGTNNIFGDF